MIINNMYFVNASPLFGGEKDVVDLKKLFEAIHFTVVLHDNKSAQVRSLCHRKHQQIYGNLNAVP